MGLKFTYIYPFILLLTAAGCGQSLKDESSFYKWLHQPGHGLVKTVKSAEFVFTVKYLPSSFLAQKEWVGLHKKTSLDSLEKKYASTHTFLLSIAPIQAKGQDIMYHKINSYEEYKQRTMDLNFNMHELLELKCKRKVLNPVLCNFENTYGASNQRNVYIVFAKEDAQQQLTDMQLTFHDEIFFSGIHHFVFHQKDLLDIPLIRFN